MKKPIILFFAFLISTSILGQNIIIKDINIIPMTSNIVIENKSVLIQNGKIKEIGAFKKLPQNKDTKIINGKGKYLMPGLADMHVHLPEENKIEHLLLSNIAAGVTQIRIMNSSIPQTDLREILNNKQLTRPKIHYSHLIRRSESYSASQADSLMVEIKNNGISFVKLLSLSDEETFDNLTKSANQYNVTLCGHYPVYQQEGKSVMVDMEKVLNSNFKSIEHLAGYIWLEDEEQIDKAIQLTKEFEIYNCPTLDWDIMSGNLQYPDDYKNRITYQFLPESITKDWESSYLASIEEAGGNEKVMESKNKKLPSFELKRKLLKRLYENDCLLLIGGDAGYDFQADGFNVYEEMMNWKNAGIDNYTILKSATVTPSKFFGEEHLWGTVEIGKNAELIILTKNPLEDIQNITTVETTIIGNEFHLNKELINQL